jgi:hypothetical protein
LPLPPDALGPVPAFFTEHLTPHLLRRPAWLAHANTAQGLQSATWLVGDVASAVAPFIAWLGEDAVFRGIGRADIRLGRHTLYLLDPARAARRYPRVPLPNPTKGLVLTIRVADLDVAANCARAAGITPVPVSGQRTVLPPEAGCGVIVEYCLG